MARLEDPELLALFREALSEFRFEGYVNWFTRPAEWIRDQLPGHTTTSIAALMWQHFEAGGEIDHVVERRAEFAAQNEFHYDFRFAVDDVDVYLETILRVTLTGPEITVVSMHRQ